MQKQTIFRSRQYLDWVKSQECCCCGAPADDPHHVIGLHWSASGMGMQAPDSMCLPACRGCHDQIHRQPALQALQPQWLLSTLSAGIQAFPDGELHEALVEAHNWCWTFTEAERA